MHRKYDMPPDHAVYDINDFRCPSVRKGARQISRLDDAHLDPTGLRITQFLILASLNEVHIASVNTLAERLDIDRAAMGKMIASLQRDELLCVAPSPTKRSSRLVELTKAGRRLLETAEPRWREAQRKLNALKRDVQVNSSHQGLKNIGHGNLLAFPTALTSG